MQVLITGADGWLARAVAASLRKEAAVVAVDSGFSAPLPNAKVLEGDIRDSGFVVKALNGVEAVVHLAPLRPFPGNELDSLEEAVRGTYVLATRALDAGVRKLVVGSTLELFDQLPAHWDVSEAWRPRPEPRIPHLRAWLAELSAREITRVSRTSAVCLRLGHMVNDEEASSLRYDPLWLHEKDAVEGVRCALAYEKPGWSVFHITAAGPRTKVRLGAAGDAGFDYRPAHDFRERWETGTSDGGARGRTPEVVLAPKETVPSRKIRNVVFFGAGGPLAAAATVELAGGYRLRLTDVRPLEEISAAGPRKDQHPGAPVPMLPEEPHEQRVVDVTSYEQVLSACEGMDAIINCSVVRNDPVGAFRVNTLGAYNVARAAVEHGIRRLVHTGPQLATLHGEGDYSSDYDIPAEAPPRPGRHLYGHSKYLGQEILRVFADHYGLEVPVLLFNDFAQPETARPRTLHPFAVSWEDAARAIRRALEAPALPSPFEALHVSADLPHGTYPNRRAKEVLGWQPKDDLSRLWSRRPG
jgi:nucleoside-diphosphate-sugar epimerase